MPGMVKASPMAMPKAAPMPMPGPVMGGMAAPMPPPKPALNSAGLPKPAFAMPNGGRPVTGFNPRGVPGLAGAPAPRSAAGLPGQPAGVQSLVSQSSNGRLRGPGLPSIPPKPIAPLAPGQTGATGGALTGSSMAPNSSGLSNPAAGSGATGSTTGALTMGASAAATLGPVTLNTQPAPMSPGAVPGAITNWAMPRSAPATFVNPLTGHANSTAPTATLNPQAPSKPGALPGAMDQLPKGVLGGDGAKGGSAGAANPSANGNDLDAFYKQLLGDDATQWADEQGLLQKQMHGFDRQADIINARSGRSIAGGYASLAGGAVGKGMDAYRQAANDHMANRRQLQLNYLQQKLTDNRWQTERQDKLNSQAQDRDMQTQQMIVDAADQMGLTPDQIKSLYSDMLSKNGTTGNATLDSFLKSAPPDPNAPNQPHSYKSLDNGDETYTDDNGQVTTIQKSQIDDATNTLADELGVSGSDKQALRDWVAEYLARSQGAPGPGTILNEYHKQFG